MEIIESKLPLNTEENINQLMDELRKNKSLMTEEVRLEICQNIQKRKIQIYFKQFSSEFNQRSAVTVKRKNINQTVIPGTPISDGFFPASSLTQEKKYIYGTYIEIAFHNFFITMSHIYGKIIGKDIMEVAKNNYESDPYNKRYIIDGRQWEDDFANKRYVWDEMFDSIRRSRPEQLEKANEMIDRHFPFLESLRNARKGKNDVVKNNPTLDWDILEDLSIILRELRNQYAHFNIELTTQQKVNLGNRSEFIFRALDLVYINAKRKVKERFSFSDQEMHCAEEYIMVNDYENRDSKGRPKKKKQDIPGYLYKRFTILPDKSKGFTAFGLLMFASLFLEKKHSKIFSDKIKCVKKVDEKVITEMLAVDRIRLHIKKLSTYKDKMALALDIINDLRKCPMELFDNLSEEDQFKFRMAPEDSENSQNENLMARYSDRFPYLVMKYIDDANLFKDIRFQVALGKYFFKFYNKKCIDGSAEPRVRSLSKDVHGFGRISEIEVSRKELWKDLIREFDDVHQNTIDDAPYVTDHTASYLINENKIGLRISEDASKSYIPELTPEGVENLPPTCWLSTYELSAMLFLILLKDSKSAESIIKDCVESYHHFFNDIKDGKLTPQENEEILKELLFTNYKGLSLKTIPQKIADYLLSKEVDVKKQYEDYCKSVLESMIEESEYRLQKIRNDKKVVKDPKQNKIGKKSYIKIKPGKIADWLASDFMLFQQNDADNKNKLTSLNYRILQSKLALFADGDFQELKRVFISAHLLGDAECKTCNPILSAVCTKYNKVYDVIDLYEKYLTERKKYLNDAYRNGAYKNLFFLYGNRTKWQERNEDFYRALAGRYLHEEYSGTGYDKAIELPRGLFSSAIREELGKIDVMRDLATDETKNISYLIYAYIKNVLHDDVQDFYDYPRSYQIFNSLFRKNPRDPKVYKNPSDIYEYLNRKSANSMDSMIKEAVNKVTLSYKDRLSLLEKCKQEDERLRGQMHQMKMTERDLKRYKVQDMLLFIVAKNILLDKQGDNDAGLRSEALKNMQLKSLTYGNILEEKIPFSVSVESTRGWKKTIKQDDLKLKNYAQFYRFLTDHRIPTLMDNVRPAVVDRNELERELDNYDKVHPEILKDVFAYEEARKQEGCEEKDFSPIVDSDSSMSFDAKKDIKQIRNAFSHSIYTKNIRIAKEQTLPEKAVVIGDTFKKHIQKKDK